MSASATTAGEPPPKPPRAEQTDDDDEDDDDADYVPDPEPEAKQANRAPTRKRARPPGLSLDDDDDDADDDDDDDDAEDDADGEDADADADADDTRAQADAAEPSQPSSDEHGVRSAHAPARVADPVIDALWAEMSAGATYHPPDARDPSAAAESALQAWLSSSAGVARSAQQASSYLLSSTTTATVAVAVSSLPRLADLEAAEAAQRSADRAARPRKSRTGLERVLGGLRGEPGPSVMHGSRQAWDSFKTGDTAVRDELNVYKKDKSRYTDRVAFLQRADVREWEYEQRGKKSRR